MCADKVAGQASRWVEKPAHRLWLLERANDLFAFFERASINCLGGFHELDDDGRPWAPGADGGNPPSRALHITTRMVHAFGMAVLMGRPGAADVVDHGMSFLWDGHRDPVHGGYAWGIGYGRAADPSKQAYGHAHVLLAGATAKMAGHPDADRLIADVSEVLTMHFWEGAHGAVAEEFAPDWTPVGAYRGQNSNMHLTESLMAAYEATGDSTYLGMARQIADLIINRFARGNDWRLPEHFTADWKVDLAYAGNPMFKPYGSTPGHWLEWSRLLLQLWELDGRKLDWMREASVALFARAIGEGWNHEKGGFYYTVGWDGKPSRADRFWWPCCEGIGAAAFLGAITGDPLYETWYRRIWDFASRRLIDPRTGAWTPQLDELSRPATDPFYGKPDIYHSVQACLIPLLPTSGSAVKGLAETGIRLTVA